QALEQALRERGAFAHRADDLEVGQRARGSLLGGEGMAEHGDVDAVGQALPIGEVEGEVEIVVENCTAQPRHQRSSLARGGTRPWLRAIRTVRKPFASSKIRQVMRLRGRGA